LRLPLGLRTIIEMKLRALADFSYIVFGVALALAFPFSKAEAQRTIQVPGDAPTVQAGINMANTGDTVSIAPGTYSGPINFNGKAITVTGSGPGVILDGGLANGPVVTFNSGETRSSILENVTVQNGISAPSPTAGGIFIDQASPTIMNSIIQNNQGCGIGVVSGAPLIQGNTVTGNQYGSNNGSVGCLPNNEFGGGGIVLYGAPMEHLFRR
jgi:parallel beta-helix repeat protein